MTEQRPPLPPFTRDSAIQKVRAAEDGWNSRDAEKVALAYTVDSEWRNRSEFVHGRREIVEFLQRKSVSYTHLPPGRISGTSPVFLPGGACRLTRPGVRATCC